MHGSEKLWFRDVFFICPHFRDFSMIYGLWKASAITKLAGSDKLNSWMMAELKECYSVARHEDDHRKGIVQQVSQRSTDSIIAAVEGGGGVISLMRAFVAIAALS